MNLINLEDCKTTASGTVLCENGHAYFVRNVYPPIQELQPRVLFVVIIFVLCFIVGICGNSSILTIIRGIVSERKSSSLSYSAGVSRRNSDNAILYIAALCVVDFLMSLSLPPAILDSIIGFWMFGTVICKLHHVCGSVGRIVSTFLITAMSFDRFVAVCHPYKTHFRSRRFVICTIIALWAAAFVLLLPMLTYAKANEVLLHQVSHLADPITGIENLTRVRVYKCSDMMPSSVFYWFTSSTFFLGYFVPLVLIVYFNSRLIRKLYRHTKVLPRSGIPLRRISIYTILIAVLYFLCWTPYWCSVLYAIYMSLIADPDDDGRTQSSELLLFIIYCVHLLPYFGSASNWILYGLLNTQLQIRHDSHSNGGGNVLSPANNLGGAYGIASSALCPPSGAGSCYSAHNSGGNNTGHCASTTGTSGRSASLGAEALLIARSSIGDRNMTQKTEVKNYRQHNCLSQQNLSNKSGQSEVSVVQPSAQVVENTLNISDSRLHIIPRSSNCDSSSLNLHNTKVSEKCVNGSISQNNFSQLNSSNDGRESNNNVYLHCSMNSFKSENSQCTTPLLIEHCEGDQKL